MPRGTKLSDEERRLILKLHSEGTSYRKIGELMGRTKNVVGRFLKDPLGYGDIKRKGRTPKLENRLKSRVQRAARSGDKSSSDLVREFDLPVSARRVRQILHEDPNMTYTKARIAPPL